MKGGHLESVACRLYRLAQEGGERPAVVGSPEGHVVRYGELADLTAAAAGHLAQLGVGPGDVVMVSLRNSLAALVALLAVDWRGGIVSPVSFRLRARELQPILDAARPKVFLHEAGLAPDGEQMPRGTTALDGRDVLAAGRESAPAAPRPADRHDADPSTLLWTSGTTGQPKGVVGSVAARVGWFGRIAAVYGLSPDDVFLAAMPLTHSAGLSYALAHVYVGAAQILLPRFLGKEVWGLIRTGGVTQTVVVPSMLRMLLQEDDASDLGRLRAVICTGAPMDPDLHRRVLRRFPGRLYTYYGSTESPQMTLLTPAEQAAHYPSVGRSFPGVRLRIRPAAGDSASHGDVLAQNPAGMLHYWPHLPGPFAEDGWLETGDLGTLDRDGYLHVFGRGHQMIISGGLNVFLPEIEEVLRGHPLVQDVAAVGVADPTWDRVAAVLVVLRQPGDPVRDEHALAAYCRERLAGYKVPRHFKFGREIPHNAGGKPAYGEIAQLFDHQEV